MANRLLRSPQYITATGGSGTLSAKLTITIQGTLRYTLVKDANSTISTLFEWAELARDYLDITYTGTLSTQPTFTVALVLNFWDAANASGTQVGTDTSQTHFGFDGYGTFYEEASPEMSTTEFPAISNYTETIGGVKTYTMYAPKNVEVKVPSILNGTIVYNSSGYNGTSVVINGTTVTINRIDCTKFTSSSGYTELNGSSQGFIVSFINKYGAIQSEFFTLKAIRDIKARRETYQSNIISSTGTYSVNAHTKQNYNINAVQSITLNSFYVPEYYSEVYSEMLLSEKVWVRYREKSTGDFITIPINIKDNNMIYKNSLNERLIQFTFSFDMSFDYINNIR
jgi:hypothetical protein